VHEADHVVPVHVHHREPGVPGGRRDPGRLGHPGRRVQEHDLGTGHHELPHLTVAGGQHVVDELPFVAVEDGAAGDQVAQLGLGEMVRRGLAEQARDPAHERPGHHAPPLIGLHTDHTGMA
jgi:hypothetical protein